MGRNQPLKICHWALRALAMQEHFSVPILQMAKLRLSQAEYFLEAQALAVLWKPSTPLHAGGRPHMAPLPHSPPCRPPVQPTLQGDLEPPDAKAAQPRCSVCHGVPRDLLLQLKAPGPERGDRLRVSVLACANTESVWKLLSHAAAPWPWGAGWQPEIHSTMWEALVDTQGWCK